MKPVPGLLPTGDLFEIECVNPPRTRRLEADEGLLAASMPVGRSH